MELLEAAGKRYAALEQRLRGVAWKRRLRANPGLLEEVLDQEAQLEEALARTRRRMELEGWPETLLALEPLRDVSRRRAHLGERVRKRLAELAVPLGAPDLKAELTALRNILQEVPFAAPAAQETRILEMKRNASIPLPVALLIFSMVPLLHLVAAFSGPGVIMGFATLLVSLVVLFVARAGEFWLTSERLVWRPVMGEPVSVSLRSIRPGGIQVERLSRGVRVEGDRIVHVRYAEPVEKLAALLELHRQPPLLGASRGGLRLPGVCLYEATLQGGPGTPARQGVAVLRPQGVSFVPRGTGREALKALTGAVPPEGLTVEPSWVLEELRWLTEAEFDAGLARVVEATDGVHWSAWEARRSQGQLLWKGFQITRGAQSLVGRIDWTQQAAASRVLEFWPSLES
jgi:hypothetical protein